MPLSDGKRRKSKGRPFRLLALTIVLAGSSSAALAQDADIVGPLTEGVRCSGSNAKEDLEFNIRKLEATDEAISVALGLVANDEVWCQPMRDAANELILVYPVATPAPVEDPSAITARQVIDQTLADADRKAASLKFEVGPPPRNMTRGRGSVPRPGT
jgi:hypothetical protein